MTTAQAAAQLTRNDASWSTNLAEPTTVTYAYRNSIPAGYEGDEEGIEAGTFSRFTAHQIAMTELIVNLYEEVSNIKMVRVSPTGYSNNATFLLGNYENEAESSTYAYSYSVGNQDRSAASTDGDFWYNLRGPNDDGGPPLMPIGSDNYTTVLHEIGHSFGLEHPTDYPDDFDYTRDAFYVQDSLQYSVMSYFAASETGADHKGQFARTLLLHDIAALQLLYGANLTTRIGNDTYGFGGAGVYDINTAAEKAVFCIWDAGGKDTLNFSLYTNTQSIDLNAEKFSSTGGLKWNMSIAAGTVIENAIGGSGVDTIIGNAVANILTGNNGNDSLIGNNGNDTLIGGAGKDALDGGAQIDTASYAEKAVTVTLTLAGATAATVFINSVAEDSIRNIESVIGGSAADILTGDALANVLDGGAGNDTLNGGAGADTLIGGLGNDRLTGGAEADSFRFVGALGAANVDTFVDFTGRTDKIQLDDAIFLAVGSSLEIGEFRTVASGNAADADDNLIYDASTGKLWYDADSAGASAAILVAQLGSAAFHATNLVFTDFVMI
ncbi:MAG: hypothetical protein JWR75_1053 [Devosia sp.]|nr:hypothetical protein [Devosia sp.]